MTQSPANAPTCAARGAAGRSKRSWLCVVAHLPVAPAAQAGVFSFSLSTSEVTFITYQEMAQAVNGRGAKRSAQILFMEKSDEQMTMQGFELGMGWTLAIDRVTGKAVITFANREEGIVIFGACTSQ